MTTQPVNVPFRVKDGGSTTALRRMQREFFKLRGSAAQALGPLTSVGRGLKSLAGFAFSARGAVTGLLAYLGGRGLKSLIDTADQLGKLATTTGDTVENLSELRTAFELGGLRVEEFKRIVTSLSRAQAQALRTGGPQLEAFRALGVTVSELQSRGAGELIRDIAGGFERLSKAEQTTVAQALFPDSFLKVLPLLGQGLEQFDATLERARKSGATITREQADAAAQLNDALTDIKTSAEGFFREIITNGTPALTDLLDLSSDLLRNWRELFATDPAEDLRRSLARSGAASPFPSLNPFAVTPEAPEFDAAGYARAQQQIADDIRRARETSRLRTPFSEDLSSSDEAGRAFLDAEDAAAKYRLTILGLREPTREIQEETARLNAALELNSFRKAALDGKLSFEQLAAIEGEFAGKLQRDLDEIGAKFEASLEPLTREGALDALRAMGLLTGDLRAELDELVASQQADKLAEFWRQGTLSTEEYLAAVRQVRQELRGESGGTDRRDTFAGQFDGLVEQFGTIEDTAPRVGEVLASSIDPFADSIFDAVTGAKSLTDAFAEFGEQTVRELSRVLLKLALVQTFQGIAGGGLSSIFSADGNVFEGGRVIPFRRGGVIDGPIGFPLAGGNRGVAGEAGPEAILPLRRKNGVLGVEASGAESSAPSVTFEINVSALDGQAAARVLSRMEPQLRGMFQSWVRNGQAETRGLVRRA